MRLDAAAGCGGLRGDAEYARAPLLMFARQLRVAVSLGALVRARGQAEQLLGMVQCDQARAMLQRMPPAEMITTLSPFGDDILARPCSAETVNSSVMSGVRNGRGVVDSGSGAVAQVNEELKQYFRPEFLNRLDEIIVFRQLTKAEVKQIADIMLKEVFTRAEGKGIKIDVTERFKARALGLAWLA